MGTLPLSGEKMPLVPASSSASCPTGPSHGGSESEIRAPRGEGANSPNQHFTCFPTSHGTPTYMENWVQLNPASLALAQIKATQTINTAKKCNSLVKFKFIPAVFRHHLWCRGCDLAGVTRAGPRELGGGVSGKLKGAPPHTVMEGETQTSRVQDLRPGGGGVLRGWGGRVFPQRPTGPHDS